VLGLVVIRPAESTWGRIAAGSRPSPHTVPTSAWNQLQVPAGSLGYTLVALPSVWSVMHVSRRRTCEAQRRTPKARRRA
jgi:hypothetical protein